MLSSSQVTASTSDNAAQAAELGDTQHQKDELTVQAASLQQQLDDSRAMVIRLHEEVRNSLAIWAPQATAAFDATTTKC